MTADLPHIFTYALELTSTFKYFLIFLGVIIEGPILMVVCGFFLRFGELEILPTFLVLLAADLLADVAWYYIGYYFAEPLVTKYGRFLGVTEERFLKVKTLFAKYHDRILFISKVTIGFGMALATLIVAGATKVPFKRYFLLNFLGEIILVAVLLAVGYVFGELYGVIAAGFKEVFIVGAILLVGAAVYGFSNFMKHKLTD